jgi:hypothetical protein
MTSDPEIVLVLALALLSLFIRCGTTPRDIETKSQSSDVPPFESAFP